METQARHRSQPPSQFRCRAPKPRWATLHAKYSTERTFPGTPHWPNVPMDLPGRRYRCARCRTAVLICSPCDRGHRYCTTQCAKQAREQSMRAAGRRYQTSRRGRHTHAERQHRYRARQKKVTHQGSPPPAPPDQLAPGPTVPVIPAPWHCWRCRHGLPEFVRQDFLRRRIRRNRLHRRMHGPHPRN